MVELALSTSFSGEGRSLVANPSEAGPRPSPGKVQGPEGDHVNPILARARGAVGARFRPQGRDPAFGLDCVGLAAWATGVTDIPADYALRGGDPARLIAALDARLTRVAAPAPGDVLLFAAARGQLHLAIQSEAGMIHADAALRRVVEQPGPAPWPMLGAWRREEG